MSIQYILEQFGNKIRTLRQERNWTLVQLEEHSGINRRYLSKIEKGNAKGVKLSHIEKLAKCFNITTENILKF